MNIYELFRAKPSNGTAHRGWLMDYMYQRNVEKSNNTDIVHHHKVPLNDIDVNKNFVAHACGTNSAGQFNGQHGVDNDCEESDQQIDLLINQAEDPVTEKSGNQWLHMIDSGIGLEISDKSK